MATTGAPAPQIAAVLAIAIELFVGIAILLGIFTRPLALLMALFMLVAAFIGHRYWTMTGADQYFNEMHKRLLSELSAGLYEPSTSALRRAEPWHNFA